MSLEAPKDIQVFTGVMDADTQSRYIKDGNYRRLLNARNTIGTSGEFGAIEDLMGNLLIGNPYLKSGRNKCVGTYEDIAGQSCIFFVWNEHGYHGIFRWVSNKAGYDNGVIEKIYQVAKPDAYDKFNPNPLGFEEDKLITGVDLVGDLLFWTNNSAQPKCINIARANETGKKRKFNLYFNRTELYASNYEIDIYKEGVSLPVYSFTWSDLDTTVADKVKSFVSAVNNDPIANQNFSVEDKINYVTIELNFVGVYYIDYRRDGDRTDAISANNFYPDFINGIPYTFDPLNEITLNRVKCPPSCAPNAEYATTIDDTLNLVTAGGWSTYPEPTKNREAGANSWYYLPTGTTGVTTHTMILNYVIDGTTPDFEIYFGPSYAFLVSINVNGTPAPLTAYIYKHSDWYSTTGSFTATIVFTAVEALNRKLWTVVAPLNVVDLKISGTFRTDITYLGNPAHFSVPIVYYNVNTPAPSSYYWYMGYGIAQTDGLSFQKNAYMFRAKYSYIDGEESVYSASSNVVIPSEPLKQNVIKVNFSDNINSNVSTSFQIKEVTLATSIDGGTTWNDFVYLDPYYWLGTDAQYYYFNNRDAFVPIDSATSLLQYHDVPLKSKSEAFIDSRIFDGGLEKGYDKINVDYTLTPVYMSLTDAEIVKQRSIVPETSLHLWKRGWEGYIGLVYYDDADRKSGVCLVNNDKIKIDSYNNQSVGVGPAYIDWAINNEPPSWATKYQWVRTNNLVCVDSNSAGSAGYAMWLVNAVNYVDENGAPVPSVDFNTAKYCGLNFDNIAYQKSLDFDYEFSFTFQAGDVVRILSDESGVYYDKPLEFDIKYVNGSNVYIQCNTIQIKPGFLIEIYSPSKSVQKDILFYEFGECYPIESSIINGVLKKFHVGQSQNQSYGTSPINTVTPATGSMKGGDVYYFDRKMYYTINDPTYPKERTITYTKYSQVITLSSGTTVGLAVGNIIESTDIPYGARIVSILSPTALIINKYPTENNSSGVTASFTDNFNNSRTVYVSSPSVNDFNEFYFTGNFRTNIKDLPGRTELPSSIDFSNQWISDQVNGLCAVQPANQQIYDTVYGSVDRMMVVNNDVLKLIFSNSYQLSVYVNQGIIRQTQGGDNIISQSDQVAGNSHLIQRTLGTTNAECVALNDEGDVMGYDENEGVAWRASGNGLLQISDNLQKSTFKNFSNRRRLLDRAKSECPAVYDLYHDEYIITLGNLQPQQQVLPKATINLFDLDPAVTVNLIQIRVMPNNTLIYSGGITGVDLNAKISDAFTAQGWTNVVDENGVTVSAPTMAYANATMVVTITYDGTNIKTYTASFDAGVPQGTGEAFEAVTICYNKQKQGWTSYYSFTPEFYGRVRDFIVSFKDGQMWLHEKGSLAKNFYGVQYPREFTFVSHKNFPKVKAFKAINVNGIGLNSAVADIEPYEGMSGMLSYVPKRAFKTFEGIQYAAFMRDRLTPGFTDQSLAMLNGRQLRGQTINVTLNNTDSTKSLVYSTEIVYFYSENS